MVCFEDQWADISLAEDETIEADFQEIEGASDDSMSEQEEKGEFVVKRKGADIDYVHKEKVDSDSDVGPMDLLEPEVLSDPDNSKKKEKKKGYGRKHRSDVEMADLHDDEQAGDTIYIDNLPNTPTEIRLLLE